MPIRAANEVLESPYSQIRASLVVTARIVHRACITGPCSLERITQALMSDVGTLMLSARYRAEFLIASPLVVIMRIFRTYARAYVDDLDAALAALATVTGEPTSTRFTMPNGLGLATIGRVLVVAGDERALKPYRATVATLIVDDLEECQELLNQIGAQIVRGPQAVPTGRNLTAKLPGGVQVEYVEWDQAQWERAGGRPA